MGESLKVVERDLERPGSRLAGWTGRHQRAVTIATDVVIILCATVPPLIAMIVRGAEVGWWGYPLILITGIALAVRRRWPLTVAIVVAIACVASPLVQPGFSVHLVPFAFALYTVAKEQTVWRAVLAIGITIVLGGVATVPYSLAGIVPPLVSPFDPFVLAALVAGVLVRQRRERRQWRVEMVNERIERAALVERTRIAAEMHDLVAHSLTVVIALANGAASVRDRAPADADAAVAEIATVSRAALDDMQRTLAIMRHADPALDADLHHSGHNLPGLAALVETVRSAGLDVTLTERGESLTHADPEIRHLVYRAVQECLTNALRHARGAQHAWVELDVGTRDVHLVIENDGVRVAANGDTASDAAATVGHGLVGMRERVARLGGRIDMGPRASGGWQTALTVPWISSGRGSDERGES